MVTTQILKCIFQINYHPVDGRKRPNHVRVLPHLYILLYLTTVQLLEWAYTYGALSYCKEYGWFKIIIIIIIIIIIVIIIIIFSIINVSPLTPWPTQYRKKRGNIFIRNWIR